MIPREQQFAEKLYAYTLPCPGAVNSRVRDLVDIVLLIRSDTLSQTKTADVCSSKDAYSTGYSFITTSG